MSMNDHQAYQNGTRFAQAYARSYGIEAAVRGARLLAERETPAYAAGVCDALLDTLQEGAVRCGEVSA